MKSRVIVLLLVMSSISFSFFGLGSDEKKVLRVGVTPVPQGEILRYIRENFKNEEFKLEIVEYSDYSQPNYDLEDGKIDVNYFQHKEFLEIFNIEKRAELVPVGEIHFEKMGIYSNNVKSIKGIRGKVAIPNDESNKIRALKLLENTGLITLDENNKIVENPREIEITEINSNYLFKIIDEVDAIVINANFMLENGYIPSRDSLALESYDERYANLLVTKKRSRKIQHIQRLEELLKSPEVRRYMKSKYKDSVIVVE